MEVEHCQEPVLEEIAAPIADQPNLKQNLLLNLNHQSNPQAMNSNQQCSSRQ
jgi:hypothetical protein